MGVPAAVELHLPLQTELGPFRAVLDLGQSFFITGALKTDIERIPGLTLKGVFKSPS